ncbi:hypothetical protein JXM67_11400 [candidate division WOR-3 bacterium]|nr:hypothetical protein [candidate division WOR-3 bacterium]
MEDEFEIFPSDDLPASERIDYIDMWCGGLSECCEEFRNQFLSHLEYFHPGVELDIELKEPGDIPTEPIEERITAVEKNVEITRANVEKLEEIYKRHIENDH